MRDDASSSWIGNRLFLAGLGVAFIGMFLMMAIIPWLYSYYTWSISNGLSWCNYCGLTGFLGEQPNIALAIISLIIFAFGIIILVMAKRNSRTVKHSAP
jgi:hypothetical protein